MRTIRLAVFLILLAGTAAAQDRPAPEAASGSTAKRVVTAERYMVVSANPRATEAGRAVLADGGSAVDAAIATQLMLNLVEPQSSGIGGGAFLVYWDAAARKLTTFDGRETAPAAATADYFLGADGRPLDFDAAVPGGRSVGVPGTLRLLELAHGLYGRLAWPELVLPVADAAAAGFEISPRLASAIAGNLDELKQFPTTAGYFLRGDGTPRPAGTLLRNPAFADTLRTVAAEGSRPLYTGPIGAALVRTIREAAVNPGLMTEADLAGYRVVQREPVCAPYRVYRICGMGPPSSGGIATAQIMAFLEHHDMAGLGPTIDGFQALLEASKLAFADRDLYLADPDHVRVPTRGLLDPAYLTTRAQLVRLDASMAKAPAGNPPWREAGLAPHDADDRAGTSHLVVVDEEGNLVSMTTTIESGFGSRLMSGGFLLNNELTDFSFAPARDGRPVANRVGGGKRPRSSMAPTIVMEDGDPVLAIGSPGGSQIIGYVAQSLTGILDWNMTPQDAVAMGHVLSRNGPAELEAGTPAAALQEALTARGQKVQVKELNSGLHAVLIRDGTLTGGIDPRREGAAAGE